MKPFSESCEQNKAPILAVLKNQFAQSKRAIEIGSGTGQHAVYFAQHLPYLTWQATDLAENIDGINAWLSEAKLPNTPPPIAIDVCQANDPFHHIDAIFSANTVHIMHWHMVEKLFAFIDQYLDVNGKFCLYGPFNYQGQYSSESNQRFDQWLKNRDPSSGIRDFDPLNILANQNHLAFEHDIEMPANNRILVWRKTDKKI